jgi:nitrogen regulatory protein PII
MQDLVEIRAIVRTEMLDRVVHRLRNAGVPRMAVTRVDAIGAGADPATTRLSVDEGAAYSKKALVRFICSGERCEMFTELIADAARTGRSGDGIISVHPVVRVTKIRTGKAGLDALL